MSVLRVEWQDHVAHVILSRAERMNALNTDLIQQIADAGQKIATRSDCRAVVMSGEGRAFCSGIDLDMLRTVSGGGEQTLDLSTEVYAGGNVAQQAVVVWRDIPVPVIAAVHGVAFGGGLQIALGADIRIVHPETRLSIMEAKWGLVPDMGGMALLPGLVRSDMLAELIYSARVFDGAEAQQLGIATQLSDDPLASALELARTIAGFSPDAIRAAKRLLNHPGPRAEILRAEAREQLALFGTPNQKEAIAAGMEKRPGRYQDAV